MVRHDTAITEKTIVGARLGEGLLADRFKRMSRYDASVDLNHLSMIAKQTPGRALKVYETVLAIGSEAEAMSDSAILADELTVIAETSPIDLGLFESLHAILDEGELIKDFT